MSKVQITKKVQAFGSNGFIKGSIVRNGKLWGIMKDKTLTYMDLSDPSSNTLIKYKENPLKPCMFIWASNSGNYCVARALHSYYLISNDEFYPKKLEPTPGAEIKSIYFYTNPKTGTEYLFVIQTLGDTVDIIYNSISNIVSNTVNSLAFSRFPVQPPVVGIYLQPLPNDTITFIIVTQDNQLSGPQNSNQLTYKVRGYTLGSDFGTEDINAKPTEFNIPGIDLTNPNRDPLYLNDGYLGILTLTKLSDVQQNLLYFYSLVQKGADGKVRSAAKALGRALALSPPNDMLSFFFSGNLMFTFYNDKTSCSVYRVPILEKETDIVKLGDCTIDQYNFVVFDSTNKTFYGFNENQVTGYILDQGLKESSIVDGRFNFYNFVYNMLHDMKQDRLAVDLLIDSTLSLNESLSICNNNITHQLQILLKTIGLVSDKKMRIKMALAARALELFVRIGTQSNDTKTPEEKAKFLNQFITWATSMVKAQLLSEKTISKTLDIYGWQEPYERLFSDQAAIAHDFAFGNVKDAANRLVNIRDDKIFVNAAIRLFFSCQDQIIDATFSRQKVDFDELSAIVSSPGARDRVQELLGGRKLTKSWLYALYALDLARRGKEAQDKQQAKLKAAEESKDKEQIDSVNREIFNSNKNFFKDINEFFSLLYQQEDKQFAYRAWFANGLKHFAAQGYKISNNYSEAARADPENALKVIAETPNEKDKKHIVLGVMRSVDEKKAGELAQNMLSGYTGAEIDTSTLLGFLPDDVVVSELENAVDKYIEHNTIVSQQQNKQKIDANKGIKRAHELIKEREEPTIQLNSFATCAKCGEPLLSGKGIVFPCQHGFHEECLKSLFKSMNVEDTPLTSNCPVCSFLSASLISLPFEPSLEMSNKWTTDLTQLRNEIEPDKKVFNIPNF